MRSKSPTLRKTETQDIYRTFIDLPEGQTAGGVFFSDEQVLGQETVDDTQRQLQNSNHHGSYKVQPLSSPLGEPGIAT